MAEEQDGQRIEYRYDALGRLQQRDSASGVSRYRFDALSSLAELSSNGHVLQMQHNELGQETQRLALGFHPQAPHERPPGALPGFALTQSYDSRQRLIGQNVRHPLEPGNATGALAPALERHYQWDHSSRLVGVSDKNQGQTHYRVSVRQTQAYRGRCSGGGRFSAVWQELVDA